MAKMTAVAGSGEVDMDFIWKQPSYTSADLNLSGWVEIKVVDVPDGVILFIPEVRGSGIILPKTI